MATNRTQAERNKFLNADTWDKLTSNIEKGFNEFRGNSDNKLIQILAKYQESKLGQAHTKAGKATSDILFKNPYEFGQQMTNDISDIFGMNNPNYQMRNAPGTGWGNVGKQLGRTLSTGSFIAGTGNPLGAVAYSGLAGGFGYVGNRIQGQSRRAALSNVVPNMIEAIPRGFQIAGISKLTNPYIDKAGLAGKGYFTRNAIKSPLNVLQGVVMDRATGMPTTWKSMAIDAAYPFGQEAVGAAVRNAKEAIEYRNTLSPLERQRGFIKPDEFLPKKGDLLEEARKYKSAEEFVKAKVNSYHGTNTEFDKFNLENIGKGEGTDAFGNNTNILGDGIYLSDNKQIADVYAQGRVKKDFITGYKDTGILGTPEPIYKEGIDDIVKKNKRIIESYVDGELLDAKTYKVNDELKELISKEIQKDGFSKANADKFTNQAIDFYRNNKKNISGAETGEFMYVLDKTIGVNNKEGLNAVNKYLASKGYSGIKYPSDLRYEGVQGNNYFIFDTNKIKTSKELTDIWNQANKVGGMEINPKMIARTADTQKFQAPIIKDGNEVGNLTYRVTNTKDGKQRMFVDFIQSKEPGKGIGTEAMQEVIKKYPKVNEIYLEASPNAAGFWKKLGATETKIEASDESAKVFKLNPNKLIQPNEAGSTKDTFIRYADDINKTTDSGRGGTWFTNDKGSSVVTDAMKSDTKKSIGGSKKFVLENKPKKPLVVETSNLSEGSFEVINGGYENYLPKKYRDLANYMYDNILGSNVKNVDEDLIIMNSLHDAGITESQARGVLNEFGKNKFDAAMDLIISKGLKEEGYDSLVLKSGEAEHLMVFDTKVKPQAGSTKILRVNPKELDYRPPKGPLENEAVWESTKKISPEKLEVSTDSGKTWKPLVENKEIVRDVNMDKAQEWLNRPNKTPIIKEGQGETGKYFTNVKKSSMSYPYKDLKRYSSEELIELVKKGKVKYDNQSNLLKSMDDRSVIGRLPKTTIEWLITKGYLKQIKKGKI